jgi:hypothetical protein
MADVPSGPSLDSTPPLCKLKKVHYKITLKYLLYCVPKRTVVTPVLLNGYKICYETKRREHILKVDENEDVSRISGIKTELTGIEENYIIISFIDSDSSTSIIRMMNSSTVTWLGYEVITLGMIFF